MFSYEQRLKVNSLPMYIYNILHTPYIYPTSAIQLSQMGKNVKKVESLVLTKTTSKKMSKRLRAGLNFKYLL